MAMSAAFPHYTIPMEAWAPALSLNGVRPTRKSARATLALLAPSPTSTSSPKNPSSRITCTAAAGAQSMPVPVSAASCSPLLLSLPPHEGHKTSKHAQHGAFRVGTPASTTAATTNTVWFPYPIQSVPAPPPSSTFATDHDVTYLDSKDSSLSKTYQSPLQDPPSTPAASDTQHKGAGEEADKDDSTSSVNQAPATIHSSTAAAEATVPSFACHVAEAEILLSLTHTDEITNVRFPGSTTLGEAVAKWAQQTSTAVSTILLRHASDEEYLSDEYWWTPLGQIRLVADGVLRLDVTVNLPNLVRSVTQCVLHDSANSETQ